jgi:EAL domain-containing protein (putative c-di-GMP-specific phosphodiesterase class I)
VTTDAAFMSDRTWRTLFGVSLALALLACPLGIEDESQRRLLLAMSCDKGQGYLFSKPLVLPAALKWLNRRARCCRRLLSSDDCCSGAPIVS